MIRVEMIRSQIFQLRGLPEIVGAGSIIKFNVRKSVAFARKYGRDIKIEATGIVTGNLETYSTNIGKDSGFNYIVRYCRIPLRLQVRIEFTSVPKLLDDEVTLDFIWMNAKCKSNLNYFDEAFSISIEDKIQISNFKQ
jgi:hypothetical protein